MRSLRFRALHDYRNVRKNGRTTKILSRHAIGLAMDVWEIEFDDGTNTECRIIRSCWRIGFLAAGVR